MKCSPSSTLNFMMRCVKWNSASRLSLMLTFSNPAGEETLQCRSVTNQSIDQSAVWSIKQPTDHIINWVTDRQTDGLTDWMNSHSTGWSVEHLTNHVNVSWPTATPTVDRLPPGLLCFSRVHEVDDILDPVAVFVVLRVVGLKWVALKTFVGLLRSILKQKNTCEIFFFFGQVPKCVKVLEIGVDVIAHVNKQEKKDITPFGAMTASHLTLTYCLSSVCWHSFTPL